MQLGSHFEIDNLAMFSVLFGSYLVIELVLSLGKRIPYFELMFAAFGIQLLISPFLEYHYFFNSVIGVMTVDESNYFGFMTYAILALYLGFKLFTINIDESEKWARLAVESDAEKYELLGKYLIMIGYLFYGLTFFSNNFIITSLSYLRFIGSLYVLYSRSSKTMFYMLIVWVPFLFITIKSVIFINLIIWLVLLYCFLKLNRKVNKILLLSLMIVGFLAISVLQSVKHVYRESAWDPNSRNKLSLTTLMVDQIKNLDAERIKNIGAIMNVRINQGWVISHGMKNLGDDVRNLSQNYLKQELIGIFLPRFLYKDKVVVGSHDKFREFTGWKLAEGTAMNIGILGDLYFNFGKKYGIVMGLVFGLLLGLLHRIYQVKLFAYPDLIFWSVLFYFMIMRAGNEFYIIMNWYFKTIIIVAIFFSFVRPYVLKKASFL